MLKRICPDLHSIPHPIPPAQRGKRWARLLAVAASTGFLALILSGCGSSNPAEGSGGAYAGDWKFTIWLTAVDKACGHTESDIDDLVGPIPVTVAANGTFVVPSPVNASGTIDSAGNVRLALAARTTACAAGEGAGGCLNVNHCDGTSVQVGDVSKWTLKRP